MKHNIPNALLHLTNAINCAIIIMKQIAYCMHSIRYPFHGDYVNLRRTPTWKDSLRRNGLKKLDRHVVFADIVNKIHRSSGKVGNGLCHGCKLSLAPTKMVTIESVTPFN